MDEGNSKIVIVLILAISLFIACLCIAFAFSSVRERSGRNRYAWILYGVGIFSAFFAAPGLYLLLPLLAQPLHLSSRVLTILPPMGWAVAVIIACIIVLFRATHSRRRYHPQDEGDRH